MGSTLGTIAVGLFKEWLEEKAIGTAPESCKHKLWKKYVDAVLKKSEA